jgi:hypothetical protein
MRTRLWVLALALAGCGTPMLPPGGSRRVAEEEAAGQPAPLDAFPEAVRSKVSEYLPEVSFKFAMPAVATSGKPALVELLLGDPDFVSAALRAVKRGNWTYRAEPEGVHVKHPDGRTLTLALLHREAGRRIYATKGTFAEGVLAALVARAVLDVRLIEGKTEVQAWVSIESPAWAKTSREHRSRLEKRIGEFAGAFLRAASGLADDITKRGDWFYGWLEGAEGVDPAKLAAYRKAYPGTGSN